MTDKCKIAEYLIRNAKAYVNNNTSITYGNVYENFDKDDTKLWRDFEEVENYITKRKVYNYNGDNIIPQYTVMLKTKRGFTADGFFDAFKTINREAYYKITNKDNTTELNDNEMQNIVNISKSVLKLEVDLKFESEEDILGFVSEMKYSGKC
ncbi:hypothetical protein [Aliarcobacter butzleri]|uniref:hypothetical protein n=1 Tax=Aliarcobacter butzleri TaxID=28197 RepID=UPI001EDFB577|nr:hypothetical protein [Aliarcobacter butzleri]MCG3681009.1 hypothetical protein [Aliarcobacter butzleri]